MYIDNTLFGSTSHLIQPHQEITRNVCCLFIFCIVKKGLSVFFSKDNVVILRFVNSDAGGFGADLDHLFGQIVHFLI